MNGHGPGTPFQVSPTPQQLSGILLVTEQRNQIISQTHCWKPQGRGYARAFDALSDFWAVRILTVRSHTGLCKE